MNRDLSLTRPYPFTRLHALLQGVTPAMEEISFGIGEPRHPAPAAALAAVPGNLALMGRYPTAKGSRELRESIAAWIQRRYGAPVDPETQILPTGGSREALFAVIQTIVDREAFPGERPLVVVPNPFYQIYEGASFLAGASPLYVPLSVEKGFKPDFSAVRPEQWKRVQALVVCSPSNPCGSVFSGEDWDEVLALSERWGFAVIADECYSEVYLDESRPPEGIITAAARRGNSRLRNIVVCQSLSKRSNLPGLRSGFCAGDPEIMKSFLLYRTYHGSAVPTLTQAISAAAWNEESHVRENRRLYREAFAIGVPGFGSLFETRRPEGGFYLWAKCPAGDDALFTRELYRQTGLLVLPGSYLSVDAGGGNPGRGYVRIALVETADRIRAGIERLALFDPEKAAP